MAIAVPNKVIKTGKAKSDTVRPNHSAWVFQTANCGAAKICVKKAVPATRNPRAKSRVRMRGLAVLLLLLI